MAIKQPKNTNNNMKTIIFDYKGHVAACTDLDNGIFINNPKGETQLGCVISCDEVLITKGAKELIKQAKRNGGSFAGLMLTKHHESIVDTNGKSSIGILGFWKHYIGTSSTITIGRDCDLSVLEDLEESDIDVPVDFKEYIDAKNNYGN